MNPHTALALAQAVLALHLTVAGFIVFGLVAIPLGALLGWPFVTVAWWRLLHLAAMGVVALQKLMGSWCFLSVWEAGLSHVADRAPHATPLFQALGERILYWNLPLTFFTWLYSALFVLVIALLFIVPPRWHTSRARSAGRST